MSEASLPVAASSPEVAISAVRVLAPDDIRPNMFVVVLREHDVVRFVAEERGVTELRRVPVATPPHHPDPVLWVDFVAVPYVYATAPGTQKLRVFDVRRFTLAAVPEEVALAVWARIEQDAAKKGK